jgi:hypothetical protein
MVQAQKDSNNNRADTTKEMVAVDSLPVIAQPISDSNKVKKLMKEHSPRKAALRSAILPGWGQIYNKKYWKLPIVYGALGISGAVFNYNLKWYRYTRFAYKTLVNKDTQNFANVHPQLKVFITANDPGALQSYRDEFRRNIDYSALVFILLWGLNVVDATVDAHLKTFDVSPDLSFKPKLGYSEMAGTAGVSFVLSFK